MDVTFFEETPYYSQVSPQVESSERGDLGHFLQGECSEGRVNTFGAVPLPIPLGDEGCNSEGGQEDRELRVYHKRCKQVDPGHQQSRPAPTPFAAPSPNITVPGPTKTPSIIATSPPVDDLDLPIAIQTGKKVCRLNKALYGLKQSPRAWFDRFRLALGKFGYVQALSNHTLFIKRVESSLTLLAVYVDDIVVTGNDSHEI
ncbi:PREDICTED: uncharacterized protein LOC109115168 [Nelumbo nucifera]|uniref:Uncharacterized protein LOC109115168 n=1 Tax=Nelumbo nucifera TaxID=4432 RepID=A0A1U8Q8N4_NELNU|nr:PREDICTED: uncharacterized protein LOC109115168 [Nelumbo nucifera]